jgi:hypothetical protein
MSHLDNTILMTDETETFDYQTVKQNTIRERLDSIHSARLVTRFTVSLIPHNVDPSCRLRHEETIGLNTIANGIGCFQQDDRTRV